MTSRIELLGFSLSAHLMLRISRRRDVQQLLEATQMEIDRFKEIHLVQPPNINRATTKVISEPKGTPNGRVFISTLSGPQLTAGERADWEMKRKQALDTNAAKFRGLPFEWVV